MIPEHKIDFKNILLSSNYSLLIWVYENALYIKFSKEY